MTSWTHFLFVIGAQLAFFIFVQWKESFTLPRSGPLLRVALTGAVVGAAFDIVVGRSLGVFGYLIPLSYFFLLVNGMLSYGIMALTVLAWRHKKIFPFYGWTIALGAFYEVANYIAPVWYWSFVPNAFAQEVILVFAAYFGLAVVLALGVTVAFPVTFRFLKRP